MKKLMILAAVAMMAVCSQAASFKWSATSSLKDYAGNAFSGPVTLYCSELGSIADTATVSSGSIAQQVFSSDDYVVNNYYNFYITYTDAQGNTFTSALKKSKAQSASTPGLTFNMTNGTWATAPEPTSALLLLLGVAGLALKRKVA